MKTTYKSILIILIINCSSNHIKINKDFHKYAEKIKLSILKDMKYPSLKISNFNIKEYVDILNNKTINISIVEEKDNIIIGTIESYEKYHNNNRELINIYKKLQQIFTAYSTVQGPKFKYNFEQEISKKYINLFNENNLKLPIAKIIKDNKEYVAITNSNFVKLQKEKNNLINSIQLLIAIILAYSNEY